MNKKEIMRFFELLDKICPDACEIFLTGAAAAAVYGNIRPTMDVDFAVKLSREATSGEDLEKKWQTVSKAIEKVSTKTGIAAQYAEDIDRWSSISLLDYQAQVWPLSRSIEWVCPNYH